LGELEDIGLENSKSALDQLVNQPQTASVKIRNKSIPVNKVAVGSIIQVKPGEMIPLDGKIVSGEKRLMKRLPENYSKRQTSWRYFTRNAQ
jgi:Cd2+/Zn2+-exporting ATPase